MSEEKKQNESSQKQIFQFLEESEIIQLTESQVSNQNPNSKDMKSSKKSDTQETSIILNATVTGFQDGYIQMIGDDFQEFQLPQVYIPQSSQLGDILQISIKKNTELQHSRESQFQEIQKQIYKDAQKEAISHRIMKNNEV